MSRIWNIVLFLLFDLYSIAATFVQLSVGYIVVS